MPLHGSTAHVSNMRGGRGHDFWEHLLIETLSPVYRGVSWQHVAASVPGHVQANGGRRGDLHGGDQECIQPSPHCAPQVRPEGRTPWFQDTSWTSSHLRVYLSMTLGAVLSCRLKISEIFWNFVGLFTQLLSCNPRLNHTANTRQD